MSLVWPTGCVKRTSVNQMEVILLPHVAMVVSKQHPYVLKRSQYCYRARGTQGAEEDETLVLLRGGVRLCYISRNDTPRRKRHTVHPETIQSRVFTSFGQPTRLIICANHGNNVICS